MADFIRGMKAGACAGVVYGIITPIITIIMLSGQSSYLSSYMGIWIVTSMIGGIIWGAIVGLFFGLIFAAAYDKTPGEISSVKGVMFSVLLWLFCLLFPVVFLSSFVKTNFFNIVLIVTLIAFSLFGFFAGFFWDKFKPTETYTQSQIPVRRCSNCGRVIPLDSRICPYCGYKFKETVE